MIAAKNQTNAVPAISLARQALKEALEARQRARVIEEQAGKIVEAARAAVELARGEASNFEGLDEDAVKARMAALKGEPGAKSMEEIRAARRNRAIAQEELDAAEQTLQAAQCELDGACGNVARAQKMAASHATSVLSELATDAIATWERANEERERLRTILLGLMPVIGAPLDMLPESQRSNLIRDSVTTAGLPYGDLPDWMHIQRKLGEALARQYEHREPGPGIAKARGYWKQFADAVLADPNAEPAPLPSSADLWG